MSYLTLHVVMFIPIYPNHVHVIMFSHNVTPTLLNSHNGFKEGICQSMTKVDIKPQVNHGGK